MLGSLFIENILQRSCFSVNIAKSLKTYFEEHLREERLLLSSEISH